MPKPLGRRQAAIVSAYTGYMMCDTSDLLRYVRFKLKQDVTEDDLLSDDLRKEIQDASFEDFEKICYDGELQ